MRDDVSRKETQKSVKDLRALVTPYAAFDQVDSLVAMYNVEKS